MQNEQKSNLEAVYELTPTQKGILLHSLKDTSSREGIYHQQFTWEFSAELSLDLFQKAWGRVVLQNEILRSAFFWKDLDKPLQAVLSEVPIEIKFEDLSELVEVNQSERIYQYLERDLSIPFIFEKAPLMRFMLFKKSDNFYTFIWSHHHIILDGWSIVLVLKQLIAQYTAFVNGSVLPLKLEVPAFQDFVSWIQNQNTVEAEKYWKSKLNGVQEQKGIKELESVTVQSRFHSAEEEISKFELQNISNYAKKCSCSIATLLQAGWALTLSRFSGQSDILFGVTSSGRSLPIRGINDMVGLFINTLPVRLQIPIQKRIKEWLNSIQVNGSEQSQWEQTSLSDIYSWLGFPQGIDPFESILVFENYPSFETPSDSPVQIVSFKANESTNYPLTLSIERNKSDGLRIEIKYKTNLFSKILIEEILKFFKSTLLNLPEFHEQTLEQLIEKLSFPVREKNIPMDQLNKNASILTKLYEYGQRYPFEVALVDEQESLSYKSLLKKVDLQSSNFRQMGIKAGDCVVLHMDRSVAVVSTIFAIWKIGAHFCIIDPFMPINRKKEFIDAVSPRLILQSKNLKEKNLLTDFQYIHSIDKSFEENARDIFDCYHDSPHNLAYIVLTSGTTGKPKPVMVEHKSLNAIARGWTKVFNLNQIKVNLFQIANTNFDVFIGDIARTFFNGGKMVICPAEVRINPPAFYAYLKNHKISILESTPQLLVPIFEYIHKNGLDVPEIKLVLMGSDALPRVEFDKMNKLFPLIRWFNTYGISEATIDTTYFEQFDKSKQEFSSQRFASSFVPIGNAFPGMNFYILDEHLLPLPKGTIGEIYIAGAGVCRGYLNNPVTTAIKFIPNPFGNGQRLYKTGDLGRVLYSGELEFLGRIDHEIKIRGHRVNIREITNLVENWEGVQNSRLIPTHNNQGIACYYTQSSEVKTEDLHSYLEKHLPSYMLPNFYKCIEAFPLNSNGKIDISALEKLAGPIKKGSTSELDDENTNPLFVQIWSEILGKKEIHPNLSFFEQGGTSLSMLQLFNMIDHHFPGKASIADLFEHDTIKKQTQFFEEGNLINKVKTLDEILADLQNGVISAEEAQEQMEICTYEY